MTLFQRYKAPRKAGAIVEAVKVTGQNISKIVKYLADSNHWYAVRRVYGGFDVDIDLKVKDVLKQEIKVPLNWWLIKDQEEGFYYAVKNDYFLEHYSPVIDFEDPVHNPIGLDDGIKVYTTPIDGTFYVEGYLELNKGDQLRFKDHKHTKIILAGK